MIIITARFQAKPGKEEELKQTLKSIFPLVKNESGVITYALHRVAKNPGTFLFYERYADKEAFDYHGTTPYFKDLSEKIKELLAEKPKLEFLEAIDGIWR